MALLMFLLPFFTPLSASIYQELIKWKANLEQRSENVRITSFLLKNGGTQQHMRLHVALQYCVWLHAAW